MPELDDVPLPIIDDLILLVSVLVILGGVLRAIGVVFHG